MNEMTAYCGLECGECGARIATLYDDDEQRAAVAKEWSEMFKVTIDPLEVNCDGCKAESGRQFNYCNVCGIRACARAKGLQSCAYCLDYVCSTLKDFFKTAPEARENLEKMLKVAGA